MEYEENIRSLLKKIDERSNYMVIMSPPPSANYDGVEWYFSAKEIDDVQKKVSKENEYIFISHFDSINDYLSENADVEYADLMETDGSHPTDAGYEVMWQAIKVQLGLAD